MAEQEKPPAAHSTPAKSPRERFEDELVDFTRGTPDSVALQQVLGERKSDMASSDAAPDQSAQAVKGDERPARRTGALVSNDNGRAVSPLRSLLTSLVVAVLLLTPFAYMATTGAFSPSEPTAIGPVQATVSMTPPLSPSAPASFEVVVDDEYHARVSDGHGGQAGIEQREAATSISRSPCRVVDTPRRLTRRVHAQVPVNVAVHEDRYYVGFVGKHDATGLVWSPQWQSVTAVERRSSLGVAAFVPTPALQTKRFVADTGHEGQEPNVGGVGGVITSVNHTEPLRLWPAERGLWLEYAAQKVRLWGLPEPSSTRLIVARLGARSFAAASVAAEQSLVRVGVFSIDDGSSRPLSRPVSPLPVSGVPRIVTSRLREVSLERFATPGVALAGVDARVVLAVLVVPPTDEQVLAPQVKGRIQLELVFDSSAARGRVRVASLEGVLAGTTVQLQPLIGRRWLLQWTRLAGERPQVYVSTLDWDLQPLGQPVQVSPSSAPALAAAVQGERHPAAFYRVDMGGHQELWVQPLHCR